MVDRPRLGRPTRYGLNLARKNSPTPSNVRRRANGHPPEVVRPSRCLCRPFYRTKSREERPTNELPGNCIEVRPPNEATVDRIEDRPPNVVTGSSIGRTNARFIRANARVTLIDQITNHCSSSKLTWFRGLLPSGTRGKPKLKEEDPPPRQDRRRTGELITAQPYTSETT
ncbi:hypothetical protein LR48_Vigan746s000700 [Vigna angularis]|uniref:Uncharacterized protein n=1 Tax=Phaseolus angularis TaxID=3914 RepID=A0A0L9THQ8_PHAAN|nr:hypothetical protein LR48_Vigan746s000700 [Vigna angularis]